MLESESRRWACSQLMLAGGYALAYEVTSVGQPSVLYCLSQINEYSDESEDRVDANGDGVKNVDNYVDIDWSDDLLASQAIRSGSVTYTAADRHVRFLVTGDPQIDFRGLGSCPFRERCETKLNSGNSESFDEAELAHSTFDERTSDSAQPSCPPRDWTSRRVIGSSSRARPRTADRENPVRVRWPRD